MAVPCGDDIASVFLRRSDIDIDGRSRFGETPLHRALGQSFNSVTLLLMEAKVECNIQNDQGQTPLSCSAAEDNEARTELLLKQPWMKLQMADKCGKTPLSKAAENGHSKIVKLLLANNANLENADAEGKIALSIATRPQRSPRESC